MMNLTLPAPGRSRNESGACFNPTKSICAPGELVALATNVPAALEVPQFGLEDAERLAMLLEERFLK